MTPSAQRLFQLDSLRAFAILAVLFEHWSGVRTWLPIGGGALGVGLFFTLSGFLITGILIEDMADARRTKRAVLASFYIRRIFRLVPAFYAVILTLALLDIEGIRTSWLWHVTYLSNIYMASGGDESVFWTLSVEEQFYLLMPMVLILAPQRSLSSLAITAILGAVSLKIASWLSGYELSIFLLPFQLEYLGAGCLLAILTVREGKRNQFEWFTERRQRIFAVVAIACISIALVDWYVHRGGPTRLIFKNLLCSVFFAWLVCKAARGWQGWIGAILNNKGLQYIGRISYGIYLVHNSMPDVVEKFFGPLPKSTAAPIVVALTFGVCTLSWRYFEQPLIRVGRALATRAALRDVVGTMRAGVAPRSDPTT